MRRYLFITSVGAVLSACTLLPITALGVANSTPRGGSSRGSTTSSSGATVAGATWDGSECKRALYQLEELNGYDYNAKPTKDDPSLEGQVLLQVCRRKEKPGYADHTITQHPRIKELAIADAWFAQDDWHVDAVSGAVFAVGQMRRHNNPQLNVLPADVGLALFWTRIVTPETLEQALAKVQIPAGARTAMVAAFRAVPSSLNGILSDDDRKILVDLPVEVFNHRQEHYNTFHALYARLDRLRAEAQATRDDPKQIDRVAGELVALRSEFFAACGKIECRAAPLYANATSELAQLYVLRGNVLFARTESSLYAREGSYVAGLAQAVFAAQEASAQKMKVAWATYQKAKSNGSDEKTARRLAGDVPAARPDLRLLEPKLSLPNYAAAIDKGEATSSSAEVERVSGGGASRTIVFKTDRFQSQESYDCQRTNRITRINSDGTLDYEENCRTRTVAGSALQHAPISVPASEAIGIQHGDHVTFMSHGDKALVIEVKRGKNIVQVRGDRVH